jgi:hypothetical protein
MAEQSPVSNQRLKLTPSRARSAADYPVAMVPSVWSRVLLTRGRLKRGVRRTLEDQWI